MCETAATARNTAVTLTIYLQSSFGHLSVYVCVTICVYMYGVCVGAYLNITTCWGSRFRVLYNLELRLNLRPAFQRSSLYIYIYIHTYVCSLFSCLLYMYVIICLLNTFPPGGYFYRTLWFNESSRFLTTFVNLTSRFTKVVKKRLLSQSVF